MAETTWDKVTNRMEGISPLTDRMDKRAKLLHLDDFQLMNFKGDKALDNVINVTGNHAAVFANALVSDLMSAKWQCKIEGDISQSQAHDIEEFINCSFDQADDNLLDGRGVDSHYAFECNQVVARGPVVRQWVSQFDKDDNYTISSNLVDSRWFVYEYDGTKLSWACPIYYMSASEIKGEYSGVLGADEEAINSLVGNDIQVRDFWDGEVNEVWVSSSQNISEGGKLIFKQKNIFGYPPFVMSFPPAGFMLRDKGYIQYEGQDALFLIEGLNEEWNRTLSVEQTIAYESLFPSYEYEVKNMDASPTRPAPKAGETKKVPEGERHQPVEKRKLEPAAQTARVDIKGMLDNGSASDAELGNASLDRSGIWFTKQWEIRQKLQQPRLRALAVIREQLARMIIQQVIDNDKGEKFEFKAGKKGKKTSISVKSLGSLDSYTITFEPHIFSKEMEIVNISVAQATKGLLPDKWIARDILKLEDLAGWDREMALQRARQMNPGIELAEQAIAYARQADNTEDKKEKALLVWQWKMLAHEYVMFMKARMMPQQPQEGGQPLPQGQEPEKGNMQGIQSMPKLLGAGLGGGKGAGQMVKGLQ